MERWDHNIAIISDQKPRTEALCKLIGSYYGEISKIPIIDTDNLGSLKNINKHLLLLIDLMGSNKKPKEIIIPLRELNSDFKIIALHIYQTPKLIDPLYNMGVNGYVFYEPSREELIHAIEEVMNGETYKPEYLRSA
jgi:DNA-binding NarL/FixJ family response regulator